MKYLHENKGSEIDLSTLEKGIYFLEISGEKGTIIKRIIKSEN
jgi:hypothetical protein